MKRLWNSFIIAFAMFSKIPMPMADWSKENMKYMLCFFPFVGTAIGILTIGVNYLATYLGFGTGFIAMLMIMVSMLITGGIHVDGLLDTSDALSSWRDRKRRLEILKDSHAGAFAVITCSVFFLIWYAALTEICFDKESVILIAIGYMVSRCLSGIGVVVIPKAREDGTVAEFSQKSEDKVVKNVLIVYLLILTSLMAYINPIKGIAMIVTAILIWCWYYRKAMKYFGGTTGDLSGYFLCICEAGLAVLLAVLGKILILL